MTFVVISTITLVDRRRTCISALLLQQPNDLTEAAAVGAHRLPDELDACGDDNMALTKGRDSDFITPSPADQRGSLCAGHLGELRP